MSDSALPKPKKSVALSGTAAGNTAICTVGRSGNDLHYRGYDILHFAETCEFEEIAYLLIYGKLPNRAELDYYKRRLKSLRGLPGSVKQAQELIGNEPGFLDHHLDRLRTGIDLRLGNPGLMVAPCSNKFMWKPHDNLGHDLLKSIPQSIPLRVSLPSRHLGDRCHGPFLTSRLDPALGRCSIGGSTGPLAGWIDQPTRTRPTSAS